MPAENRVGGDDGGDLIQPSTAQPKGLLLLTIESPDQRGKKNSQARNVHHDGNLYHRPRFGLPREWGRAMGHYGEPTSHVFVTEAGEGER